MPEDVLADAATLLDSGLDQLQIPGIDGQLRERFQQAKVVHRRAARYGGPFEWQSLPRPATPKISPPLFGRRRREVTDVPSRP
jgi:hypothetical protein